MDGSCPEIQGRDQASVSERPPSNRPETFDDRLAEAERQISPKREGRLSRKERNDTSSAFGLALRVGSDMVAGIAIGVAIGYGLDWWTGYRPAFLILFTLLGFGAGMRNVWRLVNIPPSEGGNEKDGRE